MATDLGPQMLDHLEGKRRRGEVTEGEYEARKTEILELIRTGRAVDLSAFDRATQAMLIIVGLLLGGYLILSSTTIVGVLLGAACIVGGFLGARRAGRVRV